MEDFVRAGGRSKETESKVVGLYAQESVDGNNKEMFKRV